MSRLTNLVLFIILASSVYITFSVKNDVAELATKVSSLNRKIVAEKERIDIYKAEWALLTSASNIYKLQKKLIPDLKNISVAQIQTLDNKKTDAQFAFNNISYSSSLQKN